MEWISVKIRPPKEHSWYLVAFNKEDLEELGYVDKAYEAFYYDHVSFGDGCWESADPADDGCRVSHWCELPEPPTS